MRRGTLGAAFVLLALFGHTLVPAAAQTAPTATATLAEHRPGVVLVGFEPGAPAAARAEALRSVGASSSEQLSPLATDARIVRLGGGIGVEAAIAALSRNPNVRYAEPDYVLHPIAAEANDPGYASGMTSSSGTTYRTWGLYGPSTSPNANTYGSGAGQLWAAGETGKASVYVGDIDTGIQIGHPDLDGNIWVNPGESGGGKETNGLDDDGNGYADDVNGWDFYSDDKTVYDSAIDDDHGTHTAGTIGAEGNNGTGVPGVNWDVTIIPAKFLGPSGGYTSDAVAAVDYLTALKTLKGLNIVASNNSWGGGSPTQSLLDAIRRGGDAGILFVAAAGNASSNTDSRPSYPAGYDCTRTAAGALRSFDCVIAVAAITSSGSLASYSNYGAKTVDLGAPGSGILSTIPDSTYAVFSGTSMATPHVTGAIALCASMNGSLDAAGLWATVLRAAQDTPTSSLSGKTVTAGRLSLPAMQAACAGTASVTYPALSLGITVSNASKDGIAGSGTVSATGMASCTATCTRSIGGTVVLSATPGPNAVFSGWGGACSGTGTCTVLMSQSQSVTATFAPATVALTVTVIRPGGTSASASVARVSGTSWSTKCSNVCTKNVTATSRYKITPTTSTGATGYTWTGCTTVTSGVCYITVTSSTRTPTITFTA